MDIQVMKRAVATVALGALGIVACDAGVEPSANHADPVVNLRATEAPCDTTWAAIQRTILTGRGCTASACHDADRPAGMLDLSSEVAWKNLINIESQAGINMPLITPGEEKRSLLYLKLEAKTHGTKLPAGAGSPMPTSGEAVTADELAALRLWIRAGAPADSVVAGTQALLACELPQASDPNKIPPPPVPAPGEGFQNYAGPWKLKADAEAEVCFATYYDLSDVAPDWAKIDCKVGGVEQTCVANRKHQLTQDAQSHHSVVFAYGGLAGPSDPAWGSWQCGGGEHAGKACDPTKPKVAVTEGGGDCGARAACQTTITNKLACTGFGPQDFSLNRTMAGGAQSPFNTTEYPEGVYSAIPMKGMIVWNSHAFNLTEKETTVEQYHNFWYARPEQRKFRVQSIFDIRHVFAMTVPPFESRESCATYTVPQHSRVFNLHSHVHKRGVLFRTWLPPNPVGCAPPSCQPNDTEPYYVSRLYNDPTIMDINPPMAFDDPDPASRTFKYCAVFDNGKADPSTLRRARDLPEGARPCTPKYCVGGGAQGSECSNDADCAGGVCDACTLTGGYTTEDEMFELQGAYYVQPPEK